MLQIIMDAIKGELGFLHFSNITGGLASLINLIGTDYMKDGNARNAAIDAICQILQSHKTPPAAK